MARSSNPDSAGSQFYICLADARFLDNNYTVFGQMTEGFETLDAIKRGDKMNLVTVEPSLRDKPSRSGPYAIFGEPQPAIGHL